MAAKMRVLIFLFILGCSCLLVRSFGYPEILGKGQWIVMNVQDCENPEQYELPVEFTRKKINRTHDCFNLHIKTVAEFNSSYGIDIEIYQEVDGGFKFNQRLVDDNLCEFIPKYAGGNWPRFLTQAKIDPPDCPVPAGDYTVENYVVDYEQMADTAMYGTFEVLLYVTHSSGRKICCMKWLVRFEKPDNIDEDDDK